MRVTDRGSDGEMKYYESHRERIANMFNIIYVVLDKTEQDLVIYVHLFTRIS